MKIKNKQKIIHILIEKNILVVPQKKAGTCLGTLLFEKYPANNAKEISINLLNICGCNFFSAA